MSIKLETKLTVPLPAGLRAFVEREAERGLQSQASVVRRLVAEAAARQADEPATVAA